MSSGTGGVFIELAGLALLGSWSLALPAATLTIILTLLLGRKRDMTKRTVTWFALGFSVLIGSAVMLALWALRGQFEDPLSLIVIIPGATIIALLGALPGGLFVRWLQRRTAAERAAANDVDAA